MKKILLIVDYQNDFITGSLGFEKAKELDKGIAAKIKEYTDIKDYVVFTMDTHDAPEKYLKTQEGMKLPIPHCQVGTTGWDLYGETGKIIKEHYNDSNVIGIEKVTFGSVELVDKLRFIGNKAPFGDKIYIEVVGVVTNMCVISNAIIAKAALPEAKISVIESLCASNDNKLHQEALDVLQSMQINIE
jgi:nicotinamidase-related amidase